MAEKNKNNNSLVFADNGYLSYIDFSKLSLADKLRRRLNIAKAQFDNGSLAKAGYALVGGYDPENPRLSTGDVPNPGMRNPKLIVQTVQKAKSIALRASKISDKIFDRQYLKAIKSRDSKRILAVRDLHFKGKSGVEDNRTFVHSTKAKFNSFDKSHFGETDDGFNGKGFYFASTRIPENPSIYKRTVIGPHGEIPTMNYGPNKIYSYLKGKREFDVGDPERNFFEEPNIVGILSKYFYDKNGPTEIIIGNPNNIKSAEAITYDDFGNIIPISQRDNFLINDIRYKQGGQIRKMLTASGGPINYKRWDDAKITSYTIPFIKEKAIKLTNAGRATGAVLSTNLLDSLADNAMRAGVPIRTAIGISTKETTLGNPTDTRSAWNLSSRIRGEFNGKYPGTHLHINPGRDLNERELVINYHKGHLSDTDTLGKSVILEALEFYKQHPDKYNTNQSDYLNLVNIIGEEVMKSPEVLKWYREWERSKAQIFRPEPYKINTNIQNTAQEFMPHKKQGGKMNILEFLKNGSGIHIKKKNRGKFTSYCGGKVTDECIRKAKASGNPTLVKRATFAANARKWKHKKGGKAFIEGVNVLDSNPKMSKAASKRIKKGQYGLEVPDNSNAGVFLLWINYLLKLPELLKLKLLLEEEKRLLRIEEELLKRERTESIINGVLNIGQQYLGNMLNRKSSTPVNNGSPSKTNFWNTPTIRNSQVTGDFWNTPTIANSLA